MLTLSPGIASDLTHWKSERFGGYRFCGSECLIPLAAAVPAWLATTATVVSAVSAVAGVGMAVLGGIQQSKAASAQASAANSAAKMQAELAGRAASDQRAQAQRQAIEERRHGALAQSRALAVAGASGGSASDPTVVDLTSNLAGESEYNALTALYNGESQATAIENNASAGTWEAQVQAASLRAQGRAAKTAGIIGGIGTAVSSASTWFKDYGGMFFTQDSPGFITVPGSEAGGLGSSY